MTEHPLSEMTAVVFGGGGGWGLRVRDALRRCAKRVIVIEKDATIGQIRDAVAASALVFLAVPDPLIASLLQMLRPQLADGRIVIDCASNKSGFASALAEIAATGASVCSTHPMVVSTTSPRGHNVLIMPLGAHPGPAVAAAEAIFGALDMTLERFEFDRHGDAMVIVQMVPHLVQRILIQALGHGLSAASMTIEDISRIAPANYLLAELGVGRVAAQRPDVSAGVIASALQQPFGRQIVDDIRAMLVQILETDGARDTLTALFAASVATLDPDGSWRDEMKLRTEAALVRLGNLRSRHFVVEAPNQRGVLRDILSILIDGHNIDMTALDSQVVRDDGGTALARFEIGITDEHVDFSRLAADLRTIGVRLVGTSAD